MSQCTLHTHSTTVYKAQYNCEQLHKNVINSNCTHTSNVCENLQNSGCMCTATVHRQIFCTAQHNCVQLNTNIIMYGNCTQTKIVHCTARLCITVHKYNLQQLHKHANIVHCKCAGSVSRVVLQEGYSDCCCIIDILTHGH